MKYFVSNSADFVINIQLVPLAAIVRTSGDTLN